MWRHLLILLLMLPSSLAKRDMVPVFVMDYDKVLTELPNEWSSPFTKMNSSDFSNIIDKAIQRAKVVILFVEESFCTEDVTIKDDRGSPFYNLGLVLKEDKVKYLPSVSQAFKTLKTHLRALESYVFRLSDSSSDISIYSDKLRHFYIYFKDGINETRASALRRHDTLMKEVYSNITQAATGPVVAFYTGKLNLVATETPTFLPIKTETPRLGVTIFSPGALFRFIGIYATAGARRSTFSQVPAIAGESWEEHGLTTRMTYADFELEFTFSFKEDLWNIESVALLEWGEEVGRSAVGAGAPWNWSFVCSEPLVLVNTRDGSAVTIAHYQVQPFNYKDKSSGRGGNSSDAGRGFGPVVNCGPYFSAQILAGLMVTFLCTGILMYGIGSLYSVRANGRYDDPLGKPLAIVAEGGGR